MTKIDSKHGGGVFSDSVPFEHEKIPAIMMQINHVLSEIGTQALPIGSCATPTLGSVSNDLDMIVDADFLANHFKTSNIKQVRENLRALFIKAGFNTAQSGVSVHAKVKIDNKAYQVDMMTVPKAAVAQKFHVHRIPVDSPYKGAHKHILLNKLAKMHNLLWSPYEGLYTRDQDNKKHKLYTDDIDQIARALLGPSATGKDLDSVENMFAKLPCDTVDDILHYMENDKIWQKNLKKDSVDIARIKELAGS